MIKLCECGCGQPTKIITHTCNKRKEIKGEYNRFIAGHQARGKNNSAFKMEFCSIKGCKRKHTMTLNEWQDKHMKKSVGLDNE